MKEFINTASLIHLDDQVIRQTILLRREYRKLKPGDSVIAATALINDRILVTRNSTDFKNINNLQILNPWDIS